jgi:hypothetical protein
MRRDNNGFTLAVGATGRGQNQNRSSEMSLPACQERALSAMENALRAAEPRLAARFAIFTRLASGEALPRIEQLIPQPWLLRVLASVGRAWRRLFPRSRARGMAALRAPGRPATRLRSVVVLPVLLIMMASATIATAIVGTHACASAAPRPAVAQTRWATCAAGKTVVGGSHSTGRPATGHKSIHS